MRWKGSRLRRVVTEKRHSSREGGGRRGGRDREEGGDRSGGSGEGGGRLRFPTEAGGHEADASMETELIAKLIADSY